MVGQAGHYFLKHICMQELITIHETDNKQIFSARELYDFLELDKSNWKRWYEKNITDNPFAIETLDFGVFVSMTKTNEGRPTKDFWITIDFAKRLSMLVRNEKGEEIRRYFIRCEDKLNDIKRQKDEFELLTIEQVYFLIDLIKVFSFVTNQKAVENAHKDRFIKDYFNPDRRISIDRICQNFHIARNSVLNISPEDMRQRVLRFWDEEDRLLNLDKMRRREILAVIDKYELVQHGAYDFMASIGKPSETAIKVGEIVRKMAEKMDIEIRQKNEPDLFNPDKKELNPIITNKINHYIEKPKPIKQR